MKRILILALSLTLLFSFLMVLLSPQSIYAQDNPWFTPRGPIVKTETKITTPILFPYIFGHTSPGAKITINENTIKADGKGYYKINTTAESTSPIKMTIEGPHGGKTVRLVDHSYYGVEQDVSERVIDHKLNLEEEFELQSTIEFDPTIMDIFYESLISPAPSQLPFLPKLCPYFTPPKTDFFFQNDNLLFNPPKWQDVDDASQIVRIDYDGQNVLQITQADVKHDYEVLEEVPFGPISGIYSNFHFGVMPYSPVIEGLYEQCLAADKSEENIECQKLILAFEGHTQRDCEEAGSKSDKDDCEKEKDMTLEVLEEIFGSKDPNTFHRIHGFLMGPFYTRQTAVALLDGTISVPMRMG